jgi:hypothetical protein
MFRFQVPECARAVVSAVGLEATDELVLWRMACEGECPGDAGEVFVPFSPGCDTVVTPTNNPLLVDVPGMYELRFAGATNPDVRVCYQTYARNCQTA